MPTKALTGCRVGSVPYLNAKPLIHGIEALLEVPSRLADGFAAGRYDVALLPVFEVLQRGAGAVVDGIAIAADGPVESVILCHREPLGKIRRIHLDPSSRTSTHLLEVLVRRHWDLEATMVLREPDPDAARLLIGDPALAFRRGAGEGWHFTDLAAAWKDWTGLPFVFAVWAIRFPGERARAIADALRETAAAGLAARGHIAEREDDPQAALDYLTQRIRYAMGGGEKAGLMRFRDELAALGRLPLATPFPAWA